jgi:hypothetical protein
MFAFSAHVSHQFIRRAVVIDLLRAGLLRFRLIVVVVLFLKVPELFLGLFKFFIHFFDMDIFLFERFLEVLDLEFHFPFFIKFLRCDKGPIVVDHTQHRLCLGMFFVVHPFSDILNNFPGHFFHFCYLLLIFLNQLAFVSKSVEGLFRHEKVWL